MDGRQHKRQDETTGTKSPAPEAARNGSTDMDPTLDGASEQQQQERVQIMGLETKKPLISYRDQIYDCTWGTTLGTDLIFAPPSSSTGIDPLLRHPKYDLLAATRIKLVGKPVQLVPKPETTAADFPPLGANVAVNNGTFSSSTEAQTSVTSSSPHPKRTTVPVPIDASRAKRSQASFLERLVEAKAARGETDEVYLGPKRKHDPPDLQFTRAPDVMATSLAKSTMLDQGGLTSPHPVGLIPVGPAAPATPSTQTALAEDHAAPTNDSPMDIEPPPSSQPSTPAIPGTVSVSQFPLSSPQLTPPLRPQHRPKPPGTSCYPSNPFHNPRPHSYPCPSERQTTRHWRRRLEGKKRHPPTPLYRSGWGIVPRSCGGGGTGWGVDGSFVGANGGG